MFWRYLLPGILWLLLLIGLSITPSKELPFMYIGSFTFDELMHGFFYAMLSHFWLVGFKRQSKHKKLRRKAVPIIIIFSFILGLLIEVVQEYYVVGRFFEWHDVFINVIGSFLGILIFRLVYGRHSLSTN